MTSASNQSGSRMSPTQVRAARRLRRMRRRRILRYAGGTVVGIVAFAFIASLFIQGLPLGDLFQGGAPEGPGLRVAEQGAEHVAPDAEHPEYNSNPATSGWHYDYPLAPVRWGIYDEPLEDEVLLHNLEHGYVNVHYDCPEECPELVEQLTTLIQEGIDRGGKLIMSPYPEMDTRIALTAWTFIDQFDEFDEDRIRDFVSSHESSPNAPEYSLPR